MEIVNSTRKELVLKDELYPRFGCLLFFVFPSVGISLLFSLLSLWQMRVISVSCQRVEPTQVNCQVNNSKYLGLIKDSSISLNQLTEAKFNYPSVTLVTQRGKEVSWQSHSYQEMIEMVIKINKFINYSTEPSLLIQYDLRWKKENLIPLAICITILGIGVLPLLYTVLLLYGFFYLQTLILNKSERQLTYKVFSLLGIKSKHYSFAQIQELILESYTNKDEDGDEYTSYSFKVVLPRKNRNNPFEITLMSNSDIAKVKETANTVSNFIDIPYQELSNK